MLVLPHQAITVYNAYHNAREVKYLGAEWSNDSLPVVRHVVNRTYDSFTHRFHSVAPVHDVGYVGTDVDWPELRNAAEEDAMRAA
eukprot:2355665-Lingulodinium_polyedra.AAC.1